MNELLNQLAAELGKPRPVPAQVIRHLGSAYGLGRDEVGAFLDDRLSGLPEDELDLVLAPMFTPRLEDQGRVAVTLKGTAIPAAGWPALVRTLIERPTRGSLVTEDGVAHSFDLPEVAIGRYVHRLRLDGAVSDERMAAIQAAFPEDSGGRVLAVARRAVWEHAGRAGILEHFLRRGAEEGATAEDAEQLLQAVESYEPADLDELRERLPRWQEILRQQIQESDQPKPFFNEQVAELHGGGRDQRGTAAKAVHRQREELAALERLRHILAG